MNNNTLSSEFGEFVDVLGVKIAATNLQKTSEKIEEWIAQRHQTYVCIAPVATIIDCQKDDAYRSVVNHSGITTPDGMPLVWIGKLSGKNIQRTYGPDLMATYCARSETSGHRHYFYGGSQETIDLLVKNLKERFPKLEIVGQYSPPFRGVNEKEEQSILDKINQAKPDVLWVGLGSPKQDYWMANHRDDLEVPVMIGVGAAFDFHAGTKSQAPYWMQRSGLEWFFRLCQEPKRLWRRYLLGNALFVYLITRQFFREKIFKQV